MKKLVIGFMMMILLAGCSGEKTESLTCNISGKGEGGNPTIKTIYNYTVGEEPKLVSMESETTVMFDGEGFIKDEQEAQIKEYEESIKNMEGLTHSYEIDDEKLVEHLKVDFTKVNEADLKSLDWPYALDGTFDLENFKNNMEVMGYTCE